MGWREAFECLAVLGGSKVQRSLMSSMYIHSYIPCLA